MTDEHIESIADRIAESLESIADSLLFIKDALGATNDEVLNMQRGDRPAIFEVLRHIAVNIAEK